MNPINFTAIDLETATSDRGSICEIGITVVENSEITESRSWLVRPEGNRYDVFNIYIHGITPDMTENCKSFAEIWEEVRTYLDGKVVVAHNAAFDMYALRDALDNNGIEYPDFMFYCSYRLSTYMLDSYDGYSLSALCQSYGIERDNEHRASDDSVACAKIFMKCLEVSDTDSLDGLEDKYKFNHGAFRKGYFMSQKAIRSSIKAKDIVSNNDSADPDNLFYGKNVCFTGTLKFLYRHEAMQIVADLGGFPSDGVSRKTNILVVGQQDKRIVGDEGMSNKQKKAIELIKKGFKIDIMQESDFVKYSGKQDINDILLDDFAKITLNPITV